jgi:hypothetical protein
MIGNPGRQHHTTGPALVTSYTSSSGQRPSSSCGCAGDADACTRDAVDDERGQHHSGRHP